MTTVDFEPRTVTVPLWEDPPGVFRVGRAACFWNWSSTHVERDQSPEAIARSYRTLPLADVYAVVSRYLANPVPFDEYLRRCARKPHRGSRQWNSARRAV